MKPKIKTVLGVSWRVALLVIGALLMMQCSDDVDGKLATPVSLSLDRSSIGVKSFGEFTIPEGSAVSIEKTSADYTKITIWMRSSK